MYYRAAAKATRKHLANQGAAADMEPAVEPASTLPVYSDSAISGISKYKVNTSCLTMFINFMNLYIVYARRLTSFS